MSLGGSGPLVQRGPKDLGRFGLGMKTAAFSQCRRLTVMSRNDPFTETCFSWDLDVLASSSDGAWRLLEGADERSSAHLAKLPTGRTGTLVLWETLDRLIPKGGNEQEFLNTIDRIEWHLSMVFHRFLERSVADADDSNQWQEHLSLEPIRRRRSRSILVVPTRKTVWHSG